MKRLVIADDDDVALAFLKAKMGQRGFVVTAVKDGAAALLAVASIKPDMVILDVMMPGLDGFEVLRQLKANPATQGVPVVLLSARHNVADIARAKALGARPTTSSSRSSPMPSLSNCRSLLPAAPRPSSARPNRRLPQAITCYRPVLAPARPRG